MHHSLRRCYLPIQNLVCLGNIPRELHELTGLKLLDISGNKIASGLLPRTSFFSEKRALKKKLSECDVRF